MPAALWFEFHDNFPEDQLCKRLGVLLDDGWAWRFVVQLWCWALRNAPDGLIRGVEAPQIAEDAARWDGPPGSLWAAMLQAGLVDRVGVHEFELHYFADRTRAYRAEQERLAKDRDRQKRRYDRIRSSASSPAETPQRTRTSAESPRNLASARSSDNADLFGGVDSGGGPIETASSQSPRLRLAPAPPPDDAERRRDRSRQERAYALFLRARGERTGVADAPRPSAAEFNKRMGDVLDQTGLPGWEKAVVAFLADEGYPKTCAPPWPFRLLLSQWARYHAAAQSAAAGGLAAEESEAADLVRAAYRSARGTDYPWSHADDAHLRACLKYAGGDGQRVAEMMSHGLALAASSKYPGCSNLAELRRHWAPVETSLARAGGDAQRRREAVGGDVPQTPIGRMYEEGSK